MVQLGKNPLIALAIKDDNFEETLKLSKEYGVDVVELRVDQLSDPSVDYVRTLSNQIKQRGFYLLITIRSLLEGGGREIPDTDRLKIFESVVDIADMLDIEFTSDGIREDVIGLAKSRGKLSLVSYHDFEKTPSEEFIQNYIDSVKSLGADIVKFAFRANKLEDVAKVLCITHRNRDKKIVAIAMGEVGKISRVAGFVFGSLMTYTYIGDAFAPGQIEVSQLVEELKFYRIKEG